MMQCISELDIFSTWCNVLLYYCRESWRKCAL